MSQQFFENLEMSEAKPSRNFRFAPCMLSIAFVAYGVIVLAMLTTP